MHVSSRKSTTSVPAKRVVRKTTASEKRVVPDLNESIAQRAYSLFEQRGRIRGFDLEDWLRAEREIMLEAAIH